ncbi:MAG: hypothetical protein JW941_08825 [Candidatus Coatesbacteria bacterium]|nr:hypothetical protein [Candidatus Coatesbacteria bacterium]
MNPEETGNVPGIVEQTISFLKYIHTNRVELSPDFRLIENTSLREIARLFDPIAGRYGYLPDERHYPDVFFIDTLCRFSGMTSVAGDRLGVSQHGYLFLSREAEKQLMMLASAFVNDYPWHILFPRGDLGKGLERRRGEVLDLISSLEPDVVVEVRSLCKTLSGNLEIELSDENPPYPTLIFEWAVRHILIAPLSRLLILELLTSDGNPAIDLKGCHSVRLSKSGKEILTKREVRYKGKR